MGIFLFYFGGRGGGGARGGRGTGMGVFWGGVTRITVISLTVFLCSRTGAHSRQPSIRDRIFLSFIFFFCFLLCLFFFFCLFYSIFFLFIFFCLFFLGGHKLVYISSKAAVSIEELVWGR